MNETQPLPTDAERALFEAEWLKVTGETASTWDAVCASAGEPVPAHVAGRYFARATHAAWLIWQAARRTPAPVGVEPVAKERFSEPLARVINAGYLLANCAFNLAQRPGAEISIGTAQTLSDCRKKWDAACAAHKALPPAPQPAQAQAGAVPLTDEWIRSMCKEPWIFDTAKQWVHIVEAAHGIQGGQHAE